MPEETWTIVGQGLAGTCLAWRLHERAAPFRIVDRGEGGSSRVAAGLVNPVTGKNFTPSWRIAEFLPEAVAFFRSIEDRLGRRIWHPLPVLRLAATEKEWRKIEGKLGEPDVAPWIGRVVDPPDGWVGAVEVTGGGRLDTRAFLDGSAAFFRDRLSRGEAGGGDARPVWCEGAAGLLAGRLGPHRCAKGEILTLRADWPEDAIRVGAGGWLVPLGGGLFKCGATYEWARLDASPTPEGRAKVGEIARRLGGPAFERVAHEAGVRPILRRSQPLIGPLPGGGWAFNGLGSKGSLYAPGVAERLARWLVEGREPDAALDLRAFRSGLA